MFVAIIYLDQNWWVLWLQGLNSLRFDTFLNSKLFLSMLLPYILLWPSERCIIGTTLWSFIINICLIKVLIRVTTKCHIQRNTIPTEHLLVYLYYVLDFVVRLTIQCLFNELQLFSFYLYFFLPEVSTWTSVVRFFYWLFDHLF